MPATTAGVVVTDVLPAGASLVSATPSSGTCSGTSTITCALGIFPSGAGATIDIVATAPNGSGTLTNTATVGAFTDDPDLTNNTATSMTTISALAPLSVVSRKAHGTVGNFDIDLPLSGATGIECRLGQGPNNDQHQIVVTFAGPVSLVGTPSVSSGTGSVSGASISGNQVFINLTAPNQQTIGVTLTVNNGTNATIVVPMGLLQGDVDASRRVDSTDVFQVRQHSLQSANSSNFRADIDTSGRIDSTDVFDTRQRSLTSLR
jgi:hypothetical protein